MSTKPWSISVSPASSGRTDGSSSALTHSSRSETCIAETSGSVLPATVADRAAGLRRVPPHSGQSAKVATFSRKAMTCACLDSFSTKPLLIRESSPW